MEQETALPGGFAAIGSGKDGTNGHGGLCFVVCISGSFVVLLLLSSIVWSYIVYTIDS